MMALALMMGDGRFDRQNESTTLTPDQVAAAEASPAKTAFPENGDGSS